MYRCGIGKYCIYLKQNCSTKLHLKTLRNVQVPYFHDQEKWFDIFDTRNQGDCFVVILQKWLKQEWKVSTA
jgi:hypothetical protein